MAESSSLRRRDFIREGALSATGLLFASHLLAEEPISCSEGRRHLISEIRLKAKASASELIEFYNGRIGLMVLTETPTSCSFKAGSSILNFSCDLDAEDAPFYHFAFNIPEKKIRQAEE